jgi:ubiquinone/menaquinone biosynthesis C-methylase UbiE
MTGDVHKERSRAAYDRYAHGYDTGPPGRHARWLYDSVLAAVDQCDCGSVLDVGCGTGALLERILARRPDVEAWGVDLSPVTIVVARGRLGNGVDLRVADAEALPLPDAAVDLVVCVDSFHHYPSPTVALAEMRRVTREGGALVVGEWRMATPIRRIMNAL